MEQMEDLEKLKIKAEIAKLAAEAEKLRVKKLWQSVLIAAVLMGIGVIISTLFLLT
ncbi:MAG: hypothetical protein LBE62_10255 [Azonexus sp.]|jgi:hypothetical protein|nr:hypothetical protein [Azonexus sp.]